MIAKKEIKRELGGRSPDRADAIVMAIFGARDLDGGIGGDPSVSF